MEYRLEGSSFETEVQGITGGSKAEFRRIIRHYRNMRREQYTQVRGEATAQVEEGRSERTLLGDDNTTPGGMASNGGCGENVDSAQARQDTSFGQGALGGISGSLERGVRSPNAKIKDGLYQAWCTACIYFGFSPGQVIPALYIPTASEPPIERVLQNSASYFLPILFDDSGTWCEPRWGRGGEGHQLRVVDKRWPPQPAQALKDEDQELALMEEVDLVLIPALGVDGDGVRLGQGGGWYDRALGAFADGTPVIAVVFDEEFFPPGTLPMEPHDRLVDAVITPTRFIPLPLVASDSDLGLCL